MSVPLVVNTKDGTCWTRRGSLRGGEPLYAPESVCQCPEFVMATLAELAEHGIVGSADVLPVPAGLEPQVHGVHAKVAELIGDVKSATDRLLERLAESVRDRRDHEHPTWEDLFCLNLTSWSGERMGPVLRRLLDAEARVAELEALTPAAVQTCRVCGAGYTLGEPCQTCAFQVRMAAELERRSTNEALDDAVKALKADRDRIAELEAAPTTVYRAEHPDSGITLGHYGTEAAARTHCEAEERRSWPDGTHLVFDWIEDDEDRVAELVVRAGQNEESVTGYLVTSLELASAYDEEADG